MNRDKCNPVDVREGNKLRKWLTSPYNTKYEGKQVEKVTKREDIQNSKRSY